ncbi:hypothetical protein EVAR_82956_1 [Eumeta japonica]|uniref:Uncharacterized protein n=1 Tax=Eumeta variegata TaxID=151549 RepID=A0A4C1VPD3_EUMVA|nr:hypothetical protein EVAR_82956_1 [Eumeta japonica]
MPTREDSSWFSLRELLVGRERISPPKLFNYGGPKAVFTRSARATPTSPVLARALNKHRDCTKSQSQISHIRRRYLATSGRAMYLRRGNFSHRTHWKGPTFIFVTAADEEWRGQGG